MPKIERLPLPSPSPGTSRVLTVRRYGRPGARPKAYLQAALHANELPGVLVLHHLSRRLDAAEAQGAIRGEIVVVPTANPIGLAQNVNGKQLGRMELGGGGNFNRNFPVLGPAVVRKLANRLGDDATANVAAARQALAEAVAELAPRTELEALRKTLLGQSIDADFVFDLHSHGEAVLYLYMNTSHWPGSADLPADLGCRRVLTWQRDDGHSFDEANGGPWLALAKAYPDRPLPPACLSVTVELRGHNHVDDAVNGADADNLFRFLQRRGAIAGEAGPLPPLACEAAPDEGIDHVRAPAAGVLVYRKEPGDMVAAGEVVAEIVDPLADDPTTARTPALARAAGMLFGRDPERLVRPGEPFATISGAVPLPEPESSVD